MGPVRVREKGRGTAKGKAMMKLMVTTGCWSHSMEQPVASWLVTMVEEGPALEGAAMVCGDLAALLSAEGATRVVAAPAAAACCSLEVCCMPPLGP